MINEQIIKKATIAILLTISLLATSCATNDYYYYHNVPYGFEKRQKLDLYIPKNKTGEVGLILNIHGGGWTAGDKNGYRQANAYYSGELGYVSAAINYRYASENVDAFDIMDDITSALTLIKSRAEKKDIGVSKVFLTGGSAGAHLSLLYAYSRFEEAPIKPSAVMSLSGPTDLTNEDYFNNTIWNENIYPLFSKISGYPFDQTTKSEALPYLDAASPITYVTSSSVPTIICHGSNDDIVPYSDAERLDDKLTECAVKHDFVAFPNSGHGLENDDEAWQTANNLMLSYLEEYL